MADCGLGNIIPFHLGILVPIWNLNGSFSAEGEGETLGRKICDFEGVKPRASIVDGDDAGKGREAATPLLVGMEG